MLFRSDLERLSGKFGTGRVAPRDLAALRRSLSLLPAVQSAHVQVDPDLAAYLFAGHVQDVAAPPALVEPTGHASHESPSQYWLAAQFAVHVDADPPALVVPVAQALHSLFST